jgi:hypothetical protein
LSGQESDIGFSFTSMLLVKTSSEGGVQKKVSDFGSLGTLSGGYLVKISDGYIIAGTQYDGADLQVLVSKFKVDLTRSWTRVYGKTTHAETVGGIETTAGGDLIIAASSSPETSTEADPFYLKIKTSDGTLLDSNTVEVPNIGRFQPRSIARNGNLFAVSGYRVDISIPISFAATINENLDGLVEYNGSLSSGNGTGAILAGTNGGFLHVDGLETQVVRQAFVETLDQNAEVIANFEQFSDLTDSGFLGACRATSGKYVAVGWGTNNLGVDSRGIATLLSSDLSTEETYEYSQTGKYIELTAASNTSDGGFVLAGAYDNGKEILLVKLNAAFKLE